MGVILTLLVIYLLLDSICKLKVTRYSKVNISIIKVVAFTVWLGLYLISYWLDFILACSNRSCIVLDYITIIFPFISYVILLRILIEIADL